MNQAFCKFKERAKAIIKDIKDIDKVENETNEKKV
jgi:ribulose 1,5-bisphosphate carboxylase large subunit-like protein